MGLPFCRCHSHNPIIAYNISPVKEVFRCLG
jgi:hypothetical protein